MRAGAAAPCGVFSRRNLYYKPPPPCLFRYRAYIGRLLFQIVLRCGAKSRRATVVPLTKGRDHAKGICYGFLPGATVEEKFAQAAALGFACVEIPTCDGCERRQYCAAADAAGIRVPSVMNQAHWSSLSDADPAVRAKSVEGMMASWQQRRHWGRCVVGAGAVKPDVTYEQAWEQPQAEIRRMLPKSVS